MKAGEQFASIFECLVGLSQIFKDYIPLSSLADWNLNSLSLIPPSRYSEPLATRIVRPTPLQAAHIIWMSSWTPKWEGVRRPWETSALKSHSLFLELHYSISPLQGVVQSLGTPKGFKCDSYPLDLQSSVLRLRCLQSSRRMEENLFRQWSRIETSDIDDRVH